MFQTEKIQRAVRNYKSAARQLLLNKFFVIIFIAVVFLLVLLAMSGHAQTRESKTIRLEQLQIGYTEKSSTN